MSTGLHEELTRESRAGGCKVCAFLLTLPAEAQLEWQAELSYPASIVGNEAVVRALARRGVKLMEPSVRRHRSHHVRPG